MKIVENLLDCPMCLPRSVMCLGDACAAFMPSLSDDGEAYCGMVHGEVSREQTQSYRGVLADDNNARIQADQANSLQYLTMLQELFETEKGKKEADRILEGSSS
jgi:hypothetical protein